MLILALALIASVAILSLISWLALNGADAALTLQEISVQQWRRRRNTVAAALLGGLGIILVAADLLSSRI